MTSGPVVGGTLTWGVSSAFASYVTGSIAHGEITTVGASRAGTGFAFPVRSGQGSENALTVQSSGSVRFTGHDQGDGPLLDLTVSNPRLVVDGSGARLYVDVRSKRLEGGGTFAASGVLFATVAADASDLASANGSIGMPSAPATLTQDGADAFAGYYRAGEPMSAVGVDAGLCTGAATTAVATASSTGDDSPKPRTDPAGRDKTSEEALDEVSAAETTGVDAEVTASSDELATVAAVDARSDVASAGWIALGALIAIGAFAAGRLGSGRRPTGGNE